MYNHKLQLYHDEMARMTEGQTWTWPHSDYGLAEVKRTAAGFELYEIPEYGGNPSLYGVYTDVDDIVKIVSHWC